MCVRNKVVIGLEMNTGGDDERWLYTLIEMPWLYKGATDYLGKWNARKQGVRISL